ncbi:DUF1295-domain-containing protein [Sistotremastrum suecicum HHB10207 ss-3]|uniref:DUF1295-domain-containing protein n=1 Tax=Sistotremastrum suecicum HHB10207 ss-3 TaxID=1314776 RepID=A0A166GKX0_9AGAM|nr:DUF1295-domain-containing protein [Sistotremastrum suecicum HHB10207 ss-3]
MAVLSRLLPCATSAFALQAILAGVFVPLQNEKYYDLGGAAGFLSTTFVSLYYPSLRAKYWDRIPGALLPSITSFAPRQLLLSAALGIWTARLGSFLAMRAIKAGGDSRFDEVKKEPAKFTAFWMAQATWVFVVGLPVYLVNTLPTPLHPPLGRRDFAALALVGGSFLFEVIADNQKSAWRKEKAEGKHSEKFITRGLWGISRHPNYVGEVGIWTGIWLLATRTLQTAAFPSYIPIVAAASPALTYFLLTKVSGIPPLEKSGDKKFGDDPNWKEYKERVPVMFPWGPRG